jgi:hypothetical protein
MKIKILSLIIFYTVTVQAQLHVASGESLNVIGGERLYSNESIENNGTINITDGSILEFDSDFTNDGVMDYEVVSANPGILKIGSGVASTAGASQNLEFSASGTEEIPLIQLQKTGSNYATISRGHVELTQKFRSLSGNFDANSNIDASNISTGLTFISPDATTTSIVEESVSGNVENVIVERFIPDNNRAFRFYSSSVDLTSSTDRAATISANLQEGGQITTIGDISDPRPGFGTHITGPVTTNGLDITNTGNYSMFTWDQTNQEWSEIDDTSNGTLSVGDASGLFIRGDRSLDLSVNNTQVGNSTTLRTLGNLEVGNVDVSSTLAGSVGDYTLVGNPYQAQVRARDLLGASTGLVSDYIYVFDPKIGTNGSYITVDISTATTVTTIPPTPPATTGTPVTTNLSDIIQPNQAFFVETSAASPTLVFQESYKVNNAGNVDVFSENNDLILTMTLFDTDANKIKDGIILRYNDTFNNIVSNEDADRLWNQDETFAILNQSQYLSIDKRNLLSGSDTAQLFVSNYTNNNYELNINVEHNSPEFNIYLVDNYLNTQTELLEGNNTYVFNVDESLPNSVNAERFEINVLNSTLSTQDLLLEEADLNLYPNPASSTVNLSIAGLTDSISEINVYSVNGKLVKHMSFSDHLSSFELDVNDLPNGVYIVHATTKDKTYTDKLIVK